MFKADVFSNNKYVGRIEGNSMTDIKKKASKICDNYFSITDSMVVWCENATGVAKYSRINKKSPNNTIIRGSWK